ncbi:TonB-dependent receptor [Roseisolibacter sp. H3M3-2]|uniref:TonB-dependent receptor n=1 Tax=Roseisolibacter sp. H3M3-2 TaxID=3031323 RepID=UPI0023DC3A3C|nr:TonB-dependent receptor [Roseisolibacter sp. H3M3-2]MDF1505164.1 TonB-dependent receptor [Roseisolibacter sp. H3M3-2]
MRRALGPAMFLCAATAGAQDSATVRVTVRLADGGQPLPGAIVRADVGRRPLGATTDSLGRATLRLPPGRWQLVFSRVGVQGDSLDLAVRSGQDTTLAMALRPAPLVAPVELVEPVVVSATRSERRVEDTPLRVEVVDEEEVAEKAAMTPGGIAMLLAETSGLRVQATNPATGAAGVRMQGLRGRYSLILADGLPLHGGVGGLGLLQIPPLDLQRVEVIKGAASALYGSTALGGVVNLVSRRPGDGEAYTALVNQTSRGGTDGVFFGSGPLTPHWGWTLLAGVHGQRRQDVDGDAWSDVPGYRRATARPRLFWDDRHGRSGFLTAGFGAEMREGGGVVPSPLAAGPAVRDFEESVRTRRGDVGGVARWVVPGDLASPLRGAILALRGSGQTQRHVHRFGEARERDRHRTWFGEASATLPRAGATWVGGVALQRETYQAFDVDGVDYAYTAPAAFAQADVDAAPWLTVSASARVDAHSDYGTFFSPRLSALLRRPGSAWTTRLSAGGGATAPTPFVDETEATGLRALRPLRGLRAARARSASLDVRGALPTPLGALELNATAFGSRVRGPLQARELPPGAAPRLALVNAGTPAVTWGTDVFARLRVDDVLAGELGVLGTYVFLRATEEDPRGAGRREVPLTPRHAAGLDLIWEREGRGRVGLELYYTGRQALDDDPYLDASRPYVLVGLLGEWRVDALRGARVFVNGENLGGVRQTRWAPLVRPTPGLGGRWTTDAWTELAGRTVNAGVRFDF